MACGPTYNIACCEGGVTYSWGSAWAGCLGLGDTKSTKIVVSPTQMEALRGQKIVQLAGGQSHVLALTDSCNVWAWGSAEFGKLGLGDVSQLPSDSDGVPLAKVRLRLLLCVHGGGGADMSGVCRAHPCSASHAP
jgi:alpha-tubulin suppressor-like RCC1 family protein